MAEPKPGWKTTEFWMAAFAALVGGAIAVDLFPQDSTGFKILGMASIALASLGYSVSRMIAKKGGTK